MRPLGAYNVCLPCGHGVVSDDPRWEERAPEVFQETPGQILVGVGISLGGTLQSAVQQAEGGHRNPAGVRRRGRTVALSRGEQSGHPGHRAVRRAEELLQPVVAELPHKVPQPEHVLEELISGGPPRQVVPGHRAELCLCRLDYQPGAENLPPLGAGGAPRGNSALSTGGRCRTASWTAWHPFGLVRERAGRPEVISGASG